MTILPDKDDQSIQMILSGIDQALRGLAIWCPHGYDSARPTEYYTARSVRASLEQAKQLMQSELQPLWMNEEFTKDTDG